MVKAIIFLLIGFVLLVKGVPAAFRRGGSGEGVRGAE